MRKLLILGCLGVLLAPLPGSTLRQLSLDDMIRQSTTIVRGRVQPTNVAFHGSLIFTHYRVQVSETLKGPGARQLDIGVPGGMGNGVQQTYAGAPTLSGTQDYVMFLWTSKSGLTQIIGLSQGLFVLVSNSTGQQTIVRAASLERMLNASGQPVNDSDIQMPLIDLRTRIQNVLGGR